MLNLQQQSLNLNEDTNEASNVRPEDRKIIIRKERKYLSK